MIWNPHADRVPSLVLQPARRFTRCMKQKSIWSRYAGLDHAKLPRVKPSVAADVIQIGADQRELMVAVGAANRAKALERVLVIDMTTERVTGVGRVGNHPSFAHDLRRLTD